MQNPSDEELRGFLFKKGARFRGWKKRYFVAHAGVISYFKSEETKVATGSFPVTDAIVCHFKTSDTDGINGHRFGITPAGSDRCYTLQHKELEVRDMWTAYVLQHGGKWASDDNVHRGYLYKKGNVNTQWKRRYFVVEKGELRWFEDAREKKKQGSLDVSDALVCVFDPAYDQELYEKEDRPGFLFSIKPKKSERTFLLECDSKQDLEQWLRVLPPQLESKVEKQICTAILCITNRIGRDLLLQFAKERACDENVAFWLEAEAYRNLPRNPECLVPAAEKIVGTFIRPGAEMEIGFLSSGVRNKLLQDVKAGECQEDIFLPSQKILFQHLDQALFPMFRASPYYQQAIKKLGEEETSVMNTRSRVVYEGALEFRQELKVWKIQYLVATVSELSFFTDSSKTVMVASFALKGTKAVFLGEEIYREEGKTIPAGFPFGIAFSGENKPRVYHVNQEKQRVAWLSAFKEIGLEMIDTKNLKRDTTMGGDSPEMGFRTSATTSISSQSFLELRPQTTIANQASNLHDLFEKMTVAYSNSLTKELLAFSTFLRNPQKDDEPCPICNAQHKDTVCPNSPPEELLDLNRIRKLCDALYQPDSAIIGPTRIRKCQCGASAGAVCLPMVVKSLVQCGGDHILQQLWRTAFNGTQTDLSANLQRWTMRLLWLLADYTPSVAKCWGGKKVSARVPRVEMVRSQNAKTSALYFIWRDDGLESKFIPKKLSEIRQFYDSLSDMMKSTLELPTITKAKKQLLHETAIMVRGNLDTVFEDLTNGKVYPLILCQEKTRELFYNFLQVDSGTSRCTPEFFAMNVTGTCLTFRKEKSLPVLVLDVLKQILCSIALPKTVSVYWHAHEWVAEEKKELEWSEDQKFTVIKEPFVVPLLFAATATVNSNKAVSFLYDFNHLLIAHPANSRHLFGHIGFASWFMPLLFYGSTAEEERERERQAGATSMALSPLSMFDEDEDIVEKNQVQDLVLNPIALTINILVLGIQYYIVNHSRAEVKGKNNPLEPCSMSSVLASIIARIGAYKMPNVTSLPMDTKPWSPIHVKLIQKLVGGIVGKLPATLNAFKFQEEHPGWINMFEVMTILRNMTRIPVGSSPEIFRDNIDEDTVLRCPVVAHLKGQKPPHLDYQEARVLLTESSLRGILVALKGLKLFDIDLAIPGEKSSDAIKALKGEGLANIAYFADCLQAFKTVATLVETKGNVILAPPAVAFSGEPIEFAPHGESILDRVVAQFYCSYHFDRSYSKEVEERLQAFDNYRAWSRGMGRSPGFNASPTGPITEDMKLMYMMALGIPVYTLSPKKVKQCLMFLKEKEVGTLKPLKKEEGEPARASKYNIVLEYRRKKTVFPLAEGNSICQVQPGVKMEERLVECGLEYASGMAFSISQPKRKWSLDCICLSYDTYNAWMRGLIRLLTPEEQTSPSSPAQQPRRGSVSHSPSTETVCECGGLFDNDMCRSCGQSKDSSSHSVSSVSEVSATMKAPPPKPPRKSAVSVVSESSAVHVD